MQINIHEMVQAMGATLLFEPKVCMRTFETADQNRPGLQFSGYFGFFAHERVQILGYAEINYMATLDPKLLSLRLEKYFSYPIPCIVICRGLECPEVLESYAREADVPVLLCNGRTTHFQTRVSNWLNRKLAPRQTVHGVMVDVYGVGVLLTGNSGVGKSEAALELIKRGHQLVADDVVDLIRISDDRLIGEAPEAVRHFMEIRGIGIIDVCAMFGVGSVVPSKTVDIVMHLENWVQNREYDRLGLTEEHTTLLDVSLPRILMPVQPGRNLAVVIEVAARNWRLHQMGFNAAEELNNRMIEIAARKEKGKES